MCLIGPIRGRRMPPPLGHAPREGPNPYGRCTPSYMWSLVPLGERGGEFAPPPVLYRKGRGPPFYSFNLFSFLRHLLSLFLFPQVDSPCLESAIGWGFLHHMHIVVLLESGSESIFF